MASFGDLWAHQKNGVRKVFLDPDSTERDRLMQMPQILMPQMTDIRAVEGWIL